MSKRKTVSIGARVDEELAARIKRAAQNDRRREAEWIRIALEDRLNERQQPDAMVA